MCFPHAQILSAPADFVGMVTVQRGVRNHVNLTIDNVLFFGIQADDHIPGKVDIWACGTRAWYEICPSRAYKPIYVKMVEAAVMYFSFAAVVESRGPKQPATEDFLLQYATDTGVGITLEQCKEKCREYAPFLLNHFLQEEAVMSWRVTKLWRFMHHECRHVLDALENREKLLNKGIPAPPISRRPTPPKSKKRAPSHEPITDIYSRTNRIVPQMMEKDVMDVEYSPQPGDTNDIPSPQVDAQAVDLILDVLEDIWQEESMKQKANTITESKIRSKIFLKCTCTYQEPLILINYYAKSLVPAMDPKWDVSPFLGYLLKAAGRPNPTLGHIPYSLVLRKVSRRKPASKHRHSRDKSAAAKESKTSRSTSVDPIGAKATSTPCVAVETPVQHHEQLESQAMQVEDMPTNTRRRGRPPKRQPQEPQQVLSPKPAGKTPRLRLVARKRGLPGEDSAEPIDFSRISKMARTTISTPPVESDSSNDESSPLLPGDHHMPNRVSLSLSTAKVPEFEARGPESTWVCEEEGCGFIVRGADEPQAKEEVQAHIEDHGRSREDEKERLISYAVAEGQRGHLPVEYVFLFFFFFFFFPGLNIHVCHPNIQYSLVKL